MLGIDIIEIARIKDAVEAESGQRFLDRVYTAAEIAYCQKDGSYKFNSLAARFAAKEAVAKAFGTGVRGFNLTDIEVSNDQQGKPSIVLHNQAQQRADDLNIKEIHVSLSHTHTLAFASCYLEYNNK